MKRYISHYLRHVLDRWQHRVEFLKPAPLGVLRMALAAGLALAFAAQPAAAITVAVTNGNDTGTGSFRDAIAMANGNPAIDQIVFSAGIGPVVLNSTVTYSGTQYLDIDGANAVIQPAAGGFNLFVSDAGAHL